MKHPQLSHLLILGFTMLSVSALADTSPTNGLVNYETPHVHPVDLTPDGQTLVAVNTAGHRLEVFDVRGGSPVLIDTIPVGLDPVSVRARTNSEVWVVNHISDSVSIVDLAARGVVRTLLTGNEPCDVVFAGSPQRAFVSCSEVNRIEVFNLANLDAAPQRIPIGGEDPRHLAVSPDGLTVYAAIFESGNGTTAISGGGSVTAQNVVSRPEGPYAGQNPPPNAGNQFSPPLRAGLPTPPRTAMIVRKNTSNRWMDDNNRDWSIFVNGALASLTGRVSNWDLPDRDVAAINAQTLSVSYQSRLMTMVMALGVNPANGRVTAIGTESINEVRFEPNLNGTFVRVRAASFQTGGASDIDDLNPHLDYSTSTVAENIRRQSIGDPRGIAWRGNGQQAFITGMGSNNVVIIDGNGNRLGHFSVGQGPTGIVLDDSRGRGYVMNKFDGTISTIDLNARQETGTVAFDDPTPAVIKEGRPFLYNTHLTSGLGQVSCASCHVDARTDRLSWDLGDPSGTMATVLNANNSTGNTQGTTQVHPMKGPMLTQTLQDIMNYDRLHWRGDRDGLSSFNPAFTGLLGAERQLTSDEMAKFAAFLGTIHLPPNPYRNIDNSRPATVTLPDGSTARTTSFNSLRGQNSRGNNCLQCHLNGDTRNDASNQELSQAFIAPSFAPFYDRLGFWPTSRTESTSGFGFFHDGADSIGGAARTTTAERQTDMLAEILTLEGPGGPLSGPERRQDTHAGVGQQVTISGGITSTQTNRINQLVSIANGSTHAELIVRGRVDGLTRGYRLVSGATFQADKQGETRSLNELRNFSTAGASLTFTLVANGTAIRLALDEDGDGVLNGDENPDVVDPDNLLTNGGFENGFERWDSGGTVSVSGAARSGGQAAAISGFSYVVQGAAVSAGENYRFSGWTSASGSPSGVQAGISFWDGSGNWIDDRILELPTTGGYSEFTIDVTAPAGATVGTVWVYHTGGGGSVTADDLVFKLGGNGGDTDGGGGGDNGGGGGTDDSTLPNGDFENGLTSWDRGNGVSLTGDARSGTQAARVGDLSFIVQTLPAIPRQGLTLTGAYFITGSPEAPQAGISYWAADGAWLGDNTLLFESTGSYRDFTLPGITPDGAATITVWIWSGAGGAVTVDSLTLARGDTGGGGGDTELVANGGFESDDLGEWDRGSGAALVDGARSGARAMGIGSESFLVTNRSALPGQAYVFSGHYRTESSSDVHQAGISYWTADGTWLGDDMMNLSLSPGSYRAFQIDGTLPTGAASLSAWIWSGFGGRIVVDDLSLALRGGAAMSADLSAVGARTTEVGALSLNRESEEARMDAVTDTVPEQFGGRFNGLTTSLDDRVRMLTGGFANVVIRPNGIFTGKGLVAGKSVVLRGLLDEGGTHRATIGDGSGWDLRLVAEAGGAVTLTGVITDTSGESHQLHATRAAHSASQPTDRAGAHTLLLPGESEADPMGYATVQITRSGVVRTRGKLGDGAAFSSTGHLSTSGAWTHLTILKKRPALSLLGGTLRFRAVDGVSDFDGSLIRTGVGGGAGVDQMEIPAIGSRFEPAARGARPLTSVDATGGEAIFQLRDQDTGTSDYWPLMWRPNHRLLMAGQRRIVGNVNPRTGLMRAVATDGAHRSTLTLEGVVFQRQDLIGGRHFSRQGTGSVILDAGRWSGSIR